MNKEKLMDYIQRYDPNAMYFDGYCNASDPENGIWMGDWNHKKLRKVSDFLESNGAECVFRDDHDFCSDCMRVLETQPMSHVWEPYHIWFEEHGYVCLDCVDTDDVIEETSNTALGAYPRAIPGRLIPALKEAGFTCVSDQPGTCHIYESGFHPGQTDTPREAIEALEQELPGFQDAYDYVLAITESSQFTAGWTILVREKEDW